LPATQVTTLTVLTQSGVVDNYLDNSTVSISLPVKALPTLNSIIAELETLQYSYYSCKYAKNYVSYAKNALANNNYTYALSYLLKATNQLEGLSGTQTQNIRIEIDAWIRSVAAKL